MKKLLIFAALFVTAAIMAVGIYLAVSLLSMQTNTAQDDPVITEQANTAIELYARKNYPEFSAEYNAKAKHLRLSKTTSFSLQSAASIYDDTSTYLTQAQIFALDISAVCGEPELTVELCYISKDGETMLRVASDGTVRTYWE